MNKTLIAATLAGVFMVGTGSVMAGDTDAYFDASTGKLVLPHVQVGDQTFYATLTLVDPVAYTFSIDFESFTDFTAPEGVSETANTSADAIVGTWGFDGSPTTVTFNSDGTYSQFQGAGEDDNCAAGGTETGTYTWSLETGVMLANPQVDNNQSCGLSDPRDDIPLRLFVDGNTMTFFERAEDGVGTEEFEATRQ